MITIARIDERLIHGQVSYAWTTAYKSEAVMAVDAEAARDQMQVSLLKMACPAGLKCFVANEERAVALLERDSERKIRRLARLGDLRYAAEQAHLLGDLVPVFGPVRAQRDVHLAAPAAPKYGLQRRSCASVVASPWPGYSA